VSGIAESELILNERGAVYHLNLRPDEIAHDIITVGDPERVADVSKYFDKIEVKVQTREFVTHTGYIGKKRLSVVSTGIGTDNIDIVFNELDALVNIDLENRIIKPQLTKLNIVRVGTSGGLQKDVPVDSLLVSSYGIGIDNLLNFYNTTSTDEEQKLLEAFITQTGLSRGLSKPYINHSSKTLASHFSDGFHTGITVTCPGFYGPQGRILRLSTRNPDLINKLTLFNHNGQKITNFEMETAGIYGMGKLLGHETLSLNAILANRITGEFSKDAKGTITKLIVKTLDILTSI
jgi:uridine phosphorylase